MTHVHAFENGGAGIHTGSVYYKPYKLISKNIYVGYCITENNPGDPTVLDNHSGSGIIISGTDGAVVEYCLAKDNGWDQPWEGNGPIGIWAFHANNVVIQHCISHSNKSNPLGWDGGGFDFDGGVTNSIMQYNYSYNNVGPGYGLYQYWSAAPWENNTVRYNISINDGIENDSCGIHIWSGQPNIPNMKNAYIYNNLVINDFGRAVDYKSGDVPGSCSGCRNG
ncbi:MAG TPA: right-handed parallel beta-helix repeat-containing protein [Bacteroidales bacterium]|nr:right-handed parallel beta-helix repeat-containing protein [Bacteroidales bacterium]